MVGFPGAGASTHSTLVRNEEIAREKEREESTQGGSGAEPSEGSSDC